LQSRTIPILRTIKTLLENKDMFVRRCREGFEFFRTLRHRKVNATAVHNHLLKNRFDNRSLAFARGFH
jgi:hypothetical protein